MSHGTAAGARLGQARGSVVALSGDPGLVFDAVAESYDQVRPGYPAALIDAACSIPRLGPGARILEVGSGTGKLTRDLVARDLSVDAVEPGAALVSIAQRHLAGSPVRFHIGRFEDVELPEKSFDAVFSATAFHWIDPAVGWTKVARLLRPAGGLALLTHTVELEPGLLAAWRDVLAEAAAWTSRDPETLWAGVEERGPTSPTCGPGSPSMISRGPRLSLSSRRSISGGFRSSSR